MFCDAAAVHMNMLGEDWSITTSTAEALNCIIIVLQHTAGPVASH